MFSSNPSLQIPSSIHVSPTFTSFFDLEKNDFYHEQNSNNNPFVMSTRKTQDLICQEQFHDGSFLQYSDEYDDLLESVVYPCKKKAVTTKKDGHSKIYTAQGPRDRRVRLSIDIARKFFELQNLLGFDKASKTLDWLFTKSKDAIKDLVEQTKNNSSSSVSTGQCELAFLDEDEGEKKELKFVNGKMKKMMQKHKSGHHGNAVREHARAEARARARERTKEKLRMKKEQFELKKFPDEYSCHAVSSSNLRLQSSFWGQIESESDYNESIVEKRFFLCN